MTRTSLIAAAIVLLTAGSAAAQDGAGPWIGLMQFNDSIVGREARAPTPVEDGLETRIIIAWQTPQPEDGSDYMIGRFRVNCTTRMASAMEALMMSLSAGELSREAREEPYWGDAPAGTPAAVLIGTLCGEAVPSQEAAFETDAAFVAAARRTPPAP
jgi:hypothetical protein